jgi:hemerythrin superfamily protein
MCDIYEYLKLDHKKVDKLFDLFTTAPSEKNKLEIVAMLNKELTVHAISEEETFYKTLEKHRESNKDALHAEKEHQQIKDKLEVIINIKSSNKLLNNKVDELKKFVKNHVSEEEGSIFSEAKRVLTKKEAYILKEKMHDLKGRVILEKFPD